MLGLVAVAMTVAAVLGAALTIAVTGDTLENLGLPDPGLLTRAGLPAMKTLSECAATVTVGALLFAAFFVPAQESGFLDVGGYSALRIARVSAVVWAAAAALMVPLTAADAIGRPVDDVLQTDLLIDLTTELDQTGAWALTAGIAMVVAAGCWAVLSWGATVGLFAVAVVGLMPVALTGHSSAGGAHDMATNSLLFHIVAASLWVGGLVALLAHLARDGEHGGLATSRFSRMALVCWIVMAVSGVLNALIRIDFDELVDTSYGRMLLAKTGALVVLGVVGYYQRRICVSGVLRGERHALLRLGAVEIVLMFATFGLAVALGRTPPPPESGPIPSRTEQEIGYNIEHGPNFERLVFDWRFDLLFGTMALVLAAVYLAAVIRLRRRGDAWPMGRTAAWLLGCAVVLIATSSGIGRYATAMFSVHMATHMLLSMLAPILLVLGGPVTLALRALPPAGAGNPAGPREWLLSLVHSPFLKWWVHPLMMFAMYIGSFYVVYFTGLFDTAVSSHWAHLVMNAHFLAMGYAFYWPIIGIDQSPYQLPHLGKLGMLLASLPFHAFFGIILMQTSTIIGEDFYTGLDLPFKVDLLDDQQLAGGMAWAAGEIPLVVVLGALLVQWARSDEREARRLDRRAVVDGDADLNAYNAMLTRMARQSTGVGEPLSAYDNPQSDDPSSP